MLSAGIGGIRSCARSVPHDVVGSGVRRRDGPLLKLLGLRVEHPDPAAVELAEPEAILRVHPAAARPRSRGRGREQRDLAGLRVDLADALTTEVEEEEV